MTDDPNFPFTIEGLEPYQAFKMINVEGPNRIGVLLQLPADHVNAALLILRGDQLLAKLDADGTLRVRKIVTDDGVMYRPGP